MRRVVVAIAGSSAARAAPTAMLHPPPLSPWLAMLARMRRKAHRRWGEVTRTYKAQMALAGPTVSGLDARVAVADEAGAPREHLRRIW